MPTRHMYLRGTHFCKTRASSGVLLYIHTHITTHSYVNTYIFDICIFFGYVYREDILGCTTKASSRVLLSIHL